MEHKDFNMFWKNAQGTPTRKCQGCRKLQVLCRVNPCQKKLHSNPSSPSSSIFQSYTYGSGQMANSCYLDTFLESNYHPFIRQITPERTHFDHTTPAMDTLLESIVLRRQGGFHRRKMVLWTIYTITLLMEGRLFHLAKWQEFSTSLLLCVQTCHNQKRMLSSSQIQSTSNAESVNIAVTL